MSLLTVLPEVTTFVVSLVDEVPEDEDVKAGWVGFLVFAGLVVALVILGFSLTKQLRRAQAAADAGVYGPVPDAADATAAREADGAPSGDQPSDPDRRVDGE